VDGLIASLAFDTKEMDHFDPYVQKGIPIVFFDRVEEFPYGTRVIIDNVRAGYEATAHLAAQGCRRIAHITANLGRNVYAGRLKGYKQALVDYGLPFDPNLLLVNDLSEASALRCGRQILNMKTRPDGVFATNDFFAALFLQTLKEGGLRVPEDVAIVGFNNDAISKITQPKLTTINYPGEEMGEQAARCLLENLTGVSSARSTDTIIIRSELIVRDSSLHRKI
jgi:LacI family transcriptional regulator